VDTPVINVFQTPDYEQAVHEAAALLKSGKVVVIPTETVYGAAALLSQPQAVHRLRDLRPDPSTQPLTVHLADPKGANDFLGDVTDLGQRMIHKLWPGPVGLVFEVPAARRQEVAARQGVPESELYDGSTITLRCPDHPVGSDVITAAGGTVVAVRAGIAASQPALRADQVAEELNGKVDLILDAGPTRFNKPSTIVKVLPGGYEIVRAGVYDQRIIERLLRTTILFVCSGNTCRSPMAEGLARQILAEKLAVPESELEKRGINVISAGSFAMPGARAAPHAVDALRDLGVDLSRHRSRPLSVELIHQADVVYTMARNHAMAAMSLVPSAAEKVMTLAPGRDIDDPIGSDIGVYRELAGELRTLIESRLQEKAVARLLP
jgi:L-threonylcarbamoyladenylate synthase